MELISLRSRALAAVGYDTASRTLLVRFRHGGLYAYCGVSEDVYDGLLTDAHPWTTWGAHIKASYQCDRLE